MFDALVPLVKAVLVVPITLLPIINPPSVAPVFLATAGTDDATIVRLARQVAFNAFFLLVGSLLVGTYVLEFFGVSLPIVRIGGGLLVASSAWRMLHSQGEDEVRDAAARQADIKPAGSTPSDVKTADAPQHAPLSNDELRRRSFYPLTFPLMTGPGTIAASITLGAQLPGSPIQYFANASVALIGAFVTAVAIYFSNRYAVGLLARLGPLGTLVMMRLAAFMLLCIGLDILWTGWVELNAVQRPL
jgi:multiple antibiotic resistance protein